jgi:serine/threonine-protein kinase
LGGWLLARQGHKSIGYLERVETGALFLSMVAYELMGFFMPLIASPDLTVMLALALGLFARAIYVPSTARRSLFLALAVAVPHVAIVANSPYRLHDNPVDARVNEQLFQLIADSYQTGEPDVARMAFLGALSVALWWAGTIALTTGASRVIYNLRAEVRDVKRLGQYQLEEKLGEGGMGIVYRASHAMLRRPTAIKLLPADRVGERTIARFEREVQQTARLTHPNTVTVFDFGRTPDGVFYYAMELLDGATLEALVHDDGALPPARVVHVLRQVCGSLAEAHGIGLIHRDIKPANIMLCERGGRPDRVKVLDFGLVKELKKSDAASLTQADVVTGTPQYMSPEALTHPDEVDGRSDLYALGAVAFFLITGEDVFQGGTMVEICGHHLHTEPRRPSEVTSDPVPADLEGLVMRCLAKDPDERPQTARELNEALAGCECADEWTDEDAERWWAERRDGESPERT